MISPNGIAHIQLTVGDVSASRAFYHKLLHETLGMAIQYDAPDIFYCIGGRTGVAIRGAAPKASRHAFRPMAHRPPSFLLPPALAGGRRFAACRDGRFRRQDRARA